VWPFLLWTRIVNIEPRLFSCWKILKVKADNAAFRKEHRAELKTMTAYQRDMAMPHRGYVTTNLTANIARNKKRLEELTRRLPVDNPITLSDNSSVTSESCDFHHV
jgi:hypothetical protein